MARFVRGDVVAAYFPFSGEQQYKRRPALVVASWPFGSSDDYLLCLISAQFPPDPNLIVLSPADFAVGSLDRQSYIRPAYLFASDESLIDRKTGSLNPDKLDEVLDTIRSLFD